MDDDFYVRRLLSFMCFSEKTKTCDFEKVRKAFSDWVEGSKPLKERNREIIRISEELENVIPETNDFLWYKINLNKFAGIILLYSVLGFYKSRVGKRDKHADLLIELMKCISEGNFPPKNILHEISLTYYWNDETMRYLSKTHELIQMSDEKFKNLPNLEVWLNM